MRCFFDFFSLLLVLQDLEAELVSLVFQMLALGLSRVLTYLLLFRLFLLFLLLFVMGKGEVGSSGGPVLHLLLEVFEVLKYAEHDLAVLLAPLVLLAAVNVVFDNLHLLLFDDIDGGGTDLVLESHEGLEGLFGG